MVLILRARPLLFLLLFLLLLSMTLLPSSSRAAPSSLQLGRLPLLADGARLEMAVPLGLTMESCQLETRSPSIRLQRSPVDPSECWLVFSPEEVGSVTGLLTVHDNAGDVRAIAISGEVVAISGGVVSGGVVAPSSTELPEVLLRGNHHPRELVRYLRSRGLGTLSTPGPPNASGARDNRLSITAPDENGWQRVNLSPIPGRTETTALASLGERPLWLRASLLESITVRAAAPLASSFVASDLRAYRETLENGLLRSRLAVLGRREGQGWIRWFDLRADGIEGRAYVRAGRSFELFPAGNETAGRLLRLQAPENVGVRASTPLMLRLQGARAAVVDPERGLLLSRRTNGLRFLGIAARSERRAGRAWALRQDLRTGDTHLRRWTLVMEGGEMSLRGRASKSSLEDAFGVRSLRARALRTQVHREDWPNQPLREELLLAVQLGRRAKVETPLEIRGLRVRSQGSPDVIGIRSLYVSQLRPLPDDRVRLRMQPSPVAGRFGYPRVATVGYANLRMNEVLSLRGLGERFQGMYFIPAVSHRFQTGSYSARFSRMLHADTDGKDTTLRLWELREQRVAVADGVLPGVRPLFLRSSVRGRHAYALVTDPNGLRQLRLLDVGRLGEDLPPVVSLGGRLQAQATSAEGVELRLRGRATDANGDALAVRWSGNGVRFSNPTARVTKAIFPVGVSRVRLRARELEGPTPDYENWGARSVVVGPAVGVNTPPGLRTELRAIFPNPANPRVRIAYTVGTPGAVRLSLHDVAGRRVRTLRDTHQGRGAYDLVWDGRDDAGRPVASGVYHLRLQAQGTVDTGRVVLVR